MKDGQSIFTGVAATLLMHLFVAGLVVAKNDDSGCGGGDGSAQATAFSKAETIEASLAFKEVKPKNKQPQKKKKKKFRPKVEDGASKNEKLKPEKEKKEDTVRPDEDEIDYESILDKNRKQDDDLSDTGSDEIPVEGDVAGSEWGTEKMAKGDPYVAEVRGRINSVWSVPALETGVGEALGCVRLNVEGEVVDRELKKRSKNSNLNRSVQVALKNAPSMESPVPDKLITLLTVNGICFKFVLD